jgi:hypothetical protein
MVAIHALQLVEGPVAKFAEGLHVEGFAIFVQLLRQVGVHCQLAQEAASGAQGAKVAEAAILTKAKADGLGQVLGPLHLVLVADELARNYRHGHVAHSLVLLWRPLETLLSFAGGDNRLSLV